MSEQLDEGLFILLLVIDGALLKTVDDPFAVGWRNVNLVFLQAVDGSLRDLIQLPIEGPILFLGVLHFPVEAIDVLDVVGRNASAFGCWRTELVEVDPLVLQVVCLLDLDVLEQIGNFDDWQLLLNFLLEVVVELSIALV